MQNPVGAPLVGALVLTPNLDCKQIPVGAPLVGALVLTPNLDCIQIPVGAPLVGALVLTPNLDCKQIPVGAPLVGALVLTPNLDCKQIPVGAPPVGAQARPSPFSKPEDHFSRRCHAYHLPYSFHPNLDRTSKFQHKCTKISDIIALYRYDNSHRCVPIVIVIQWRPLPGNLKAHQKPGEAIDARKPVNLLLSKNSEETRTNTGVKVQNRKMARSDPTYPRHEPT